MNRSFTSRSLAAIMSLALAGLFLTPLPAFSAETEDLTWNEIAFGQSVDLNFSANVLPEKVGVNHADPDVPGTVEGDIFMESRGGKIAPGHDGLTFYHVDLDPNEHNFVLTADVTVHQLGPETDANPNGQEGAGLMVRDLNGGARQDPMLPGFEEVPAASNIASTSLFRNGPAAVTRTGVTEPWGNVGSERTVDALVPGSDNSSYLDYLDTPVHMTLARTDTEFSMTAEVDGVEHTHDLEGADWVQDIDPDGMTVGLYAARNVAVTFSNVSLTRSDADTQPRPESPEPVTPVTFDVRSPQHSGTTDYRFAASASYDGVVDVAVDGETVVEGATVTAGERFEETLALVPGENDVSTTYTPTDEDAPSMDPETRSFTVDVREFDAAAALIVDVDGTPEGDATVDAPVDLDTAIRYVLPGQSVELLAGTYQPSSNIVIAAPYSGVEGAPKTLTAHEDAEVTLDGSGALSRLIMLEADHWAISDLHLTNAASNGLRISGSHNVIDNLLVNYNGDTGVQLSGSGPDRSTWPSYNLITNSESHDNMDPGMVNADGFAAKLGVGPRNEFRGNAAHHNIDDGWDLYNRTNEGPNYPVRLIDNVAYSNGELSDGTNEDSNIGVGFKLGGEGLPVAHVVEGNVAFDNNLDGFSDNFNPGQLELTNNTSVDNKRFNYIFRINPYFTADEQGVFLNNVSARTFGDADNIDWVSGVVDGSSFFFDGSRSVSS